MCSSPGEEVVVEVVRLEVWVWVLEVVVVGEEGGGRLMSSDDFVCVAKISMMHACTHGTS